MINPTLLAMAQDHPFHWLDQTPGHNIKASDIEAITKLLSIADTQAQELRDTLNASRLLLNDLKKAANHTGVEVEVK